MGQSHHSYKPSLPMIAGALGVAVSLGWAARIEPMLEASAIAYACQHEKRIELNEAACFLDRNNKSYAPQIRDARLQP